MAIKTGKELAAAAKAVAENKKTLYVMGCFGAPMNATNKSRYKKNHSYNKQADRQKKIDAATADTFGFDCVCFIKGLLWGWNGDTSKTYGGAKYESNGVPDINADAMIAACNNVRNSWKDICIGEVVWMKGHIGIYIGNGLVAECTPKWKDCVQITYVKNLGAVNGYNGRTWTKHGKLPYVTYQEEAREFAVNVKELKKGSKGDSVKALQTLLVGYGYDCGSYGNNKNGIDSSFGSATEKAVNAYKKANGLDVNGIVDEEMWRKLLGL